MSEALVETFDPAQLDAFLYPGESLISPSEHGEDDLRDRYGYEAYPIQDASGEKGNSVFLVMEKPGDSVEPVELVEAEITLTITPAIGEGVIVLKMPDEEAGTVLLTAGSGGEDGGSFVLEAGWSYAYLNIGDGPFVIRDDSRRGQKPEFKPEYEVSADDPEYLTALRDDYNIPRSDSKA